ncbi:MAG: response regulator [bacterium]
MEKKHRILVIDDHVELVKITREMLEDEGFEVAIANDGTQGIATAREFQPDIILCDLNLPGEINGYGVAQALREDLSISAFLAALTAHAGEEYEQKARDAGFDRMFTKPLDIDDFTTFVKNQ